MTAASASELARAREFYHEQLAVSFRYSRRLSEPLGRVAEAIVDTPGFDAVLQECGVGSFDCARRVGDMAVIHLDRLVPAAGAWPDAAAGSLGVRDSSMPGAPEPWWRDLLNYERGCFLQTATTVQGPPTNRPRRSLSAMCMNFSWAVPELVERIQAGRAITEDLRRPLTLLFARAHDGRVCVVEVGAAVEKVFRATNGLRTLEQIAASAGIDLPATRQIIESLARAGAVVPAMSPEEMARLISARENRL